MRGTRQAGGSTPTADLRVGIDFTSAAKPLLLLRLHKGSVLGFGTKLSAPVLSAHVLPASFASITPTAALYLRYTDPTSPHSSRSNEKTSTRDAQEGEGQGNTNQSPALPLHGRCGESEQLPYLSSFRGQ